jgi:two-component system, response regulator FlrC
MSLTTNNLTSAKILVVEDDPTLREALTDTLELANFEVAIADSGEEALKQLALHNDIALVVSDVNMGGMDGHQLLREIKSQYPHIPVILNTAYGSIDRSVEAMRDGAVDYLVKPFEPQLLVETVSRYVGGNEAADDEPVANDASSQQLLQLARRVAESDSTVLIIGESGTGKEVLARYVHQHSPRAKKPFVAINCAAIPENMLEAMLFGHEKGAYTGAHSSAPGKFEQANGGTILLDEISEMDMGLQAKLLRVLQEREVERLGGRKTITLDVRVVATSNRDMRRQVAEGKFREDLYFRLSVLPLQWAPLRDRPADIVPLAEKLLSKHAQKQYRKGVCLSAQTQQTLLSYPWPGNVRELDNVMQRALILQPGRTINPVDLGLVEQTCYSDKPSLVDAAVNPQSAMQSAASQFSAQSTSSAFSGAMTSPAEASSVIAPVAEEESAALGDDLKQREFEIIVSTLKQERGSKKGTAERLGISPRTLRYKIAKLKEQGFDLHAAMA